MNLEKVKKLVKIINNAQLVIVDDSPYLHSVNVANVENDPENEVLMCNWHDDEGQEFEVKFTEEGLDKAKIYGHKILLQDHEGEPSEIWLFDLEPICIDKQIETIKI